jgi:7-carboxy-7-deazaguanine synthase
MDKSKYRYTEIFQSFQGEGTHTGRNTIWIRWFLCNLQCNGFGQKDPTDPSTYKLPYEEFDVDSVKKIEDLPVWNFGCDSSYSWSKRYRHLAYEKTTSEIADEIESLLTNEYNPLGKFIHDRSGSIADFCMTGGEPMMRRTQTGIIELLGEFLARDNFPHRVTVETNGTQKLTEDLGNLIKENYDSTGRDPLHEWFWSVSPKLWSTSGEQFKRAIKPDVVASYANVSNRGHLKYVVNGSQQSWDEVDEHTEKYRALGVKWPVYIMPVGATQESQQEDIVAEISDEALRRGFHVSGRLHCYVYGNAMST